MTLLIAFLLLAQMDAEAWCYPATVALWMVSKLWHQGVLR